jgi:hypothetical protein
VGYAALSLGIVAVGVGVLWPLLSPGGRTGVLLAAGVAWPVQVVSFVLLLRMRDRINGFLAIWVGSTLVRMGLVVVAAVVVARRPELPPLPTLLALAGFFFVMLLLEPLFFRPQGRSGPTGGGPTGTTGS